MFSLTVNIVSEFFDRHFFGELPHRCIETDLSVGLDFLCRLKMRFAL